MTDSGEELRRRVAETYASWLTNPQRRGCCDQPIVAMQATGYDVAEIGDLPGDAVINAFGCGSPVDFSDIAPGDVVADLGCGAGLDLLLAAAKVEPTGRVIGVDMTDAMIQRAWGNIAAAGAGNVEVRKGIIEDLPLAEASIDWVISNCVLNLSPDKPRAFAEIARVLKPGGRMRVADIIAEDLPEWVQNSRLLYDSCIGGAISEDAYATGLRNAGLTDVTIGNRHVYDRDTLCGFAAATTNDPTESHRVADALVGRIWSAYISASKPTPIPRSEARNDQSHNQRKGRRR